MLGRCQSYHSKILLETVLPGIPGSASAYVMEYNDITGQYQPYAHVLWDAVNALKEGRIVGLLQAG